MSFKDLMLQRVKELYACDSESSSKWTTKDIGHKIQEYKSYKASPEPVPTI